MLRFLAVFLSVAFAAKTAWAEPTTVYLDGLTWVEVRAAIDDGYTSVIIPTGGTEQNGPHMILGKHNYIVAHAAGEIAKRAGNTLVAPVVPYTPEGDIDPPTGHMKFAGTMSLSPKLFGDILTSIAASLKVHGFRHIYFIGDSGPNQAVQDQIARDLDSTWTKDGVRVTHLAAYYTAAEAQIAHLKSQGFNEKQIGRHAGMRDTSELMAVFAQGVNAKRPGPPALLGFGREGYSGDPSLASAVLGEEFLEMKISAAVKSMQEPGTIKK